MERIIDFSNYPVIITVTIACLDNTGKAAYEIKYQNEEGETASDSYISEHTDFPFMILLNYDKLMESSVKILSIMGNVYLYSDKIYDFLQDYENDENMSVEDITLEDFLPLLDEIKMSNYLYINYGEYSDDIRYIRQLMLVDVETSIINLSQLDNLERLKLVNIYPKLSKNNFVIIDNVSSLKHIHLENAKIDNIELLYDNRNLNSIYLEFTDLELRYISCPELQKVNLTGLDEGLVDKHGHDEEYTKTIEKMISKNQSISSLTVTYSNITNIFDGKHQKKMPYNIEILDLSNNFLQSIPQGLYDEIIYGKYFKLKFLNLGFNKIHYIPKELKQITSLKTLDLTSNQLASNDVEVTVKEGENTKNVMLMSSHMENLWGVTSLTALALTDNSIMDVNGITSLTNLVSLDVTNNFITSLPENIGDMIKLEVLMCGNNNLTILPESICNLTSLKILEINGNNITSLPRNMYKMTSLDSFITDDELLQKYINMGNLNASPEGDVMLVDLLNAIKTYPQNLFKKKILYPIEKKRIKRMGETGQRYKWQKGCIVGNMSLTDEELFEYVIESVLLILDVTGNIPESILSINSSDESYIRDELKRKYEISASSSSISSPSLSRRLMCADLSLMLDIYKDYLIPLKNMCANELISGDEIEDVPFGQMLTFREEKELYCLTVDDLTRMQNEGNTLNPYTRRPIQPDVFETLEKRRKFLDWIDTIEITDEDRLAYDTLWNKISRLYPIGEMNYKKIDEDKLRDMYNVLRSNTEDNLLPLIGEDLHLALVKVFNAFIGNLNSPEFTERAALVNQLMKGDYVIEENI